MQGKAKLLGHPVHQMLIVFPLGLLATSVVFDIIHLLTGTGLWAEVAFWMIVAGLIGGLAAAVFGVIDWLAIPAATRAKTIGLYHGAGNFVVVLLFAISLGLRIDAPAAPGPVPIVLSIVAVAIAGVTGWLGGELVVRYGVGVDPGANLNAPHSLSGEPARRDTIVSPTVGPPARRRQNP